MPHGRADLFGLEEKVAEVTHDVTRPSSYGDGIPIVANVLLQRLALIESLAELIESGWSLKHDIAIPMSSPAVSDRELPSPG